MNGPEKISAIKTIEQIPWRLFGIGAPKCATTWVARQLGCHRGVFQTGERDFFAAGSLLTGAYSQFDSEAVGDFMADPLRICSTYSNLYLYDTSSLHFIKRRYPDAKIYVNLRNPLARTLSHHLHNMVWVDLYGPNVCLEDALRDYASSGLLEMSFYHRYLPAWIDAFGRENVFVFISDEIRKKPREYLARLWDFLRIGAHGYQEQSTERINKNIIETVDARLDTIDYLQDCFAPTIDYVQELIGRDLSGIWTKNLSRVSPGSKISKDQVLLARAVIHYENGAQNYGESLEILKKLYQKQYPHPLVYNLAATILTQFGRTELAEQVREAGRRVCMAGSEGPDA